jgi:hypothetical protein
MIFSELITLNDPIFVLPRLKEEEYIKLRGVSNSIGSSSVIMLAKKAAWHISRQHFVSLPAFEQPFANVGHGSQ